jgi:cytidylate kinase
MNNSIKLIIAIDGYSSCGKSTFAKSIAREMAYIYIDSGAMYRAVTLYCIEKKIIQNGKTDKQLLLDSLQNISIDFKLNKTNGSSAVILNGRNVENRIRTLDVSENVSQVSRISEIREKMVAIQRKMGENRGIVMDGRDIGTVVFPQADIKIFMTADPHVRAVRRYQEMLEKGIEANLEEIEKNINERDYMDSTRADSPLKKAVDAILLDNTNMTPEEQMEWFREIRSVRQ